MLCKGMTKRADPFTTWEEAQANPQVTKQHTLEILEELERVPEIEVQEEEDFTETVEIQLHPNIRHSPSS